MSGYAAESSGNLRPLGDVLALIAQNSGRLKKPAEYFSFGKEIRPLEGGSGAVEAYGTSAPYNCRGGGCDNQESRIDTVLRAIVEEGKGALNVVVTDLWLDNRAFSGSPQVALGGPLRAMLDQGQSIGVIGVRAPFSGTVYDIPGGGAYKEASERPLFILAVGPAADVAQFHTSLTRSGSPSFGPERLRYSLFSAEAANPVVPARLQTQGGGVARGAALAPGLLTQVPQYRMQLGLAAQQKGRIAGAFDPAAKMHPGTVWRGPFAEQTRVWRLADEERLRPCSGDAWNLVAPLREAWRPAPNSSEHVIFALEPGAQAILRPGNVYFIEARLGTNQLEAPNPANQWMREWSLAPSEAKSFVEQKPTAFKALNLADLTGIMEQELQRQAGGRTALAFGFILKVDR